MYVHPHSLLGLGAKGVLRPKSSTQSARAWSVHATVHLHAGLHLHQEGHAVTGLPYLLSDLTDGQTYGQGIGLTLRRSATSGTDLLILFSDHSALVGHTDAPYEVLDRALRPMGEAAQEPALQGRSVRLAPAILHAPALKVEGTVSAHYRSRRALPNVLIPELLLEQLAQDWTQVLDAMHRIGPVRGPWNTAPGGVCAPWLLGAAKTLDHLAPVVQGACLAHGIDPHAYPQIRLNGWAMDDAGAFVPSIYQVVRLLDSEGRPHRPLLQPIVDAIIADLAVLRDTPGMGWHAGQWTTHSLLRGEKPGRAAARRGAERLLTTAMPSSAHGRLHALAYYQEAMAAAGRPPACHQQATADI